MNVNVPVSPPVSDAAASVAATETVGPATAGSVRTSTVRDDDVPFSTTPPPTV